MMNEIKSFIKNFSLLMWAAIIITAIAVFPVIVSAQVVLVMVKGIAHVIGIWHLAVLILLIVMTHRLLLIWHTELRLTKEFKA